LHLALAWFQALALGAFQALALGPGMVLAPAAAGGLGSRHLVSWVCRGRGPGPGSWTGFPGIQGRGRGRDLDTRKKAPVTWFLESWLVWPGPG